MERISTIMRWLQDFKYISGLSCDDYEAAKELIDRLEGIAAEKARATAPNSASTPCIGGDGLHAFNKQNQPSWKFCPLCGVKL